MNTESSNPKNNSKAGYILSVGLGTIASYIVNAGELGFAGVLGGLIFVLVAGGILAGIIYIFYRKHFQNIFTIACVIISILAVLGNQVG